MILLSSLNNEKKKGERIAYYSGESFFEIFL
jgi:hypothetical protein